MNKVQLMKAIKRDVVWYAQPRNMNARPKTDLERYYADAKRLGLVKKK